MQMINLMEGCFDKFYLSKYNIRDEMWPLTLSKYSTTFGNLLLKCIFIHEGQRNACFFYKAMYLPLYVKKICYIYNGKQITCHSVFTFFIAITIIEGIEMIENISV